MQERLTVKSARQIIHDDYFYIDLIEEQIRRGYDVKNNQRKLTQYKSEIEMLEQWINENIQNDDESIL